MIEAELPDGTILEFPAGTPDAVVDRTVRQHLAGAQGGGGVMGWLGRRGRDVIEGLASFPSAAAEAIVPGRSVQRMVSERMGVPAQAAQRMAPTLSEGATGAADALGLPRPQTDEERMTSAVIQGVVGAVPTMGIGAGTGAVQRGISYLSQGVGGAAGGAAAEGARQAGYGEAVQTVAGLAGGLGGAAGVQGAAAAGRGAAGMVAPFTQRGREQVVVDALMRSSGDPANLRARIEQSLADPDARLPGSPVTTAVAARDPQLLAVEAAVRDGALGPDVAAPVREAQVARNMAQRAELDALGDTRSPAERGAAVRRGLVGGGTDDVNDIGARQALSARVDQLYGQVDPQGSLRIPTGPVLMSARDTLRTLFDPATGGEAPPPALQSVIDDLRSAGAAMPWRFAQNIRSRLGEIAGRASAAGENRLASAAGSISEAIDNTAMTQPWARAIEARRNMGQVLGRDATGANAAGRITATDRFNNPTLPDEQVTRVALSSPGNARQILEAQYQALDAGRRARLPADQMQVLRDRLQETRQALRGQFIADLTERVTQHSQRVNAEGVAGRPMSPAAWSRIWEERAPIAREIFDAPTLRRLELLSRDFAEASIGANAGRSAGSQTAQNLSVGGLIARASNGLLDPNIPAAQTIFSAGGVMRLIYQAPEQATRELFAQAMADPRFAAMLLARASPNSVQRATAYIEQTMTQRLAEAAAIGAQRQIIRTGSEEERRRAQRQ